MIRFFLPVLLLSLSLTSYADPNDPKRLDILVALASAKMPADINDEDSMKDVARMIHRKLISEKFCYNKNFDTVTVRLCEAELQTMINDGLKNCALMVNEEVASHCNAGREFFKKFTVADLAQKKCEETTSKLYEDFCTAGVQSENKKTTTSTAAPLAAPKPKSKEAN